MTEIKTILSRFENKGLIKGYRTFRNMDVEYSLIEEPLNLIIKRRIEMKKYGEVLSLIYLSGRTYNQNIIFLMQCLYEQHDYPTFLKQAYRFNIYGQLKKEISFAIDWHINNHKVDGFAWKVKFLSFAKNINESSDDAYEKIDEEESIKENKIIALKIQPINRNHNKCTPSTAKYIQIQYDKKKLWKKRMIPTQLNR